MNNSSVFDALDNMVDDFDAKGGFSTSHLKPEKRVRHERTLLVKQLLRFLENVDEDLTCMEIRQALEEELPQ